MISITFGLPIPVERQPTGSLAVNVALLRLEVPGSIPGDGTSTFCYSHMNVNQGSGTRSPSKANLLFEYGFFIKGYCLFKYYTDII